MSCSPFACATLLLALPLSLPAQTAAPTPALAPPHVLLDTVGPEGWRLRLGPTNVGSLLESEQGRALWQPQTTAWLGMWQQLAGEAGFAAAKDRLLGYSGRVRLAVWMQDDATRGGVVRAAVVLDADGRTDLAALATDLKQWQEQVPGEWAEADVGGQKLAVRQNGDDTMTVPTQVGQSLVVAMASADHLGTAFAAASAMAASATGKAPAPTTPALRLELDLPALLALASRGDAQFFDVFGARTLGQLAFTVATAGPHLQFEVAQQFKPAPSGLIAAFCPPVQGVPALQLAATPATPNWRVGHFDWQALYDGVVAAIAAFGRGNPAEAREEIRKELGIDPVTDLLAHLTTEHAVFGSPLQGLDRPEDASWTLALKLKDEAAFRRGLETLLDGAKPTLTRGEPTTIGGIECQRYAGPFNYRVWFATAYGNLFLAGGRDAEAQLAAAFAATKPGAAPAAKPVVAGAFADLAKALPPGVNSQARGELDVLFAVPGEMWSMVLREFTPLDMPRAGDDAEARERFHQLLLTHRLGTVRSATGYADATWRWRLYW